MGRIGGELDGPGEGLDLPRIHLVARPCILHGREQRDVLARFGPGGAGLESDGGGDVERLRDHLHGDGRRARSDPGVAGDIPGFDPLIPELGELVGRDAGLALAVHFDVAQRRCAGDPRPRSRPCPRRSAPLAAPFTLAVKVMFAPVTAVGNDAWRTVIEETFARDAAAEAPVPLSRVRASRVSRSTRAGAGRRRESLPHRRGRVDIYSSMIRRTARTPILVATGREPFQRTNVSYPSGRYPLLRFLSTAADGFRFVRSPRRWLPSRRTSSVRLARLPGRSVSPSIALPGKRVLVSRSPSVLSTGVVPADRAGDTLFSGS